MRNLSLFGCVLALIVSSGCQSDSFGFRNPFKDRFARTFPSSFPELMTKSKDSESEKRGVFNLGGVGAEDADAGAQSVSDAAGSSEMSSGGQVSQVESILERGDAAFAAEDLQQAAAFYQQALTLEPQNVHAHHRLAIIHDQQQDYAVAEQHYEAALKVEPENISILNDLGYSYYLQRRYEDSKAYLEFIRKIKPDNQLALRNLALVHAAEGDIQQAYELFQQGGLSGEQSRQQIQQAVARADEGRAETRNSRMGVASTQLISPGTSSVGGVASVERENAAGPGIVDSAIAPGRARTQSPRGGVFQPQPDLESAYGLNAHQPAGRSDPSLRTQTPASQLAVYQQDQQHVQPPFGQPLSPADRGVERVSYNPPPPQQASEEQMIRLALNTGYGNLFPVISTEDYDHARRDFEVDYGADARNAYYEQFGQPDSTTPHVVHADAVRSPAGDDSANRMRNVSYGELRAAPQGSSRIQSPMNRSDQQGASATPMPANRFPVTETNGQTYQQLNYSQFPKQEQSPFAGSSGSTDTTENPGDETTGIRIAPKSEMSVPQYGGGVGAGAYFINEPPQRQLDSDSYNDGPQASPMSESDRKAHELALERYRRQMQQQ